MYSERSGLILAFHGCDETLRDKVINGGEELKPSTNPYDWLGHGIYFWENSPARALSFAEELMLKNPKKSSIKIPSILGAVIDLKYCLDLTEYKNLQILKEGYSTLESFLKVLSITLPENKNIDSSDDLLLRHLDCAVIQTIHDSIAVDRKFDSVGMFIEGNTPYPNAGFKEKNHIQICIRNPNCIKGYFKPRNLINF